MILDIASAHVFPVEVAVALVAAAALNKNSCNTTCSAELFAALAVATAASLALALIIALAKALIVALTALLHWV